MVLHYGGILIMNKDINYKMEVCNMQKTCKLYEL